MKIAHISPHYYPSIGGVEKVVKEICEGLVKLGHDVSVITTKRLQRNQKKIHLKNYEIINGVKVYRFSSLLSLGHMSFEPAALLHFVLNNYDIVHMHSLRHPHTIYLPLIKVVKESVLVMQGHTHFENGKFKTFLYRNFDNILFKTLYKKINCFLALNFLEKNKLIDLGVDNSRIHILYNPVNSNLFNKPDCSIIDKNYELSGKRIILFLGQAHRGKRIDLILKAMQIILKENKDVILIIAGPDFGNYPRLKEYAKSLNVQNNILFLGLISEEDKRLFLHRCDFLVLPSEYEAFGVVLAEAMAAGKPVIATKTPGPLEIVQHGYNGFLIELDSYVELADYSNKLLNDKNLREELGTNAKNFAFKNFKDISIVKYLNEIYHNLANSTKCIE